MQIGSIGNTAASAAIKQQVPNVAGKGPAAEQIEAAILKHREEHAEKSSGATDANSSGVNISV